MIEGNFMKQKLLYTLLSALLLTVGWYGGGGFTMLVALLPLLEISRGYGSSARDWWRMAGWAALAFVLWNVATIWWVWIAAPIGPIVATIFSTFWNLVAFMLYHYVSKRAHKAVAYTLLVSSWIFTEYCYISAEVLSFPWLTLGNGFSGDVWAVQWYEFTGNLGGSLWVLLSNIAIFEAWHNRSRWSVVRAGVVVLLPIAVSLAMYWSYKPSERLVKVSVLQPNVDCYEEKFSDNAVWQMQNIGDLFSSVPRDTRVVVLPETALPERLNDDKPLQSGNILTLRELVEEQCADAMVVAGASTIKFYPKGVVPSETARRGDGYYYDFYNSAVAVNSDSDSNLHHKMRLVIGVESMPFTNILNKFVDLGPRMSAENASAYVNEVARGKFCARVSPDKARVFAVRYKADVLTILAVSVLKTVFGGYLAYLRLGHISERKNYLPEPRAVDRPEKIGLVFFFVFTSHK